MKKIIFTLLFITSLTGCAFLNQQKVNWQACQADPTCVAQAKDWQSKVEVVSLPAAMAIPFPGAAAAPKILGYLGFAIAMLIGGHAITKKQTVTPPSA